MVSLIDAIPVAVGSLCGTVTVGDGTLGFVVAVADGIDVLTSTEAKINKALVMKTIFMQKIHNF